MRHLVFLVCALYAALCGHTTFDGKTVPPLPVSGTVVNVSSVPELYMALRNQQAGQTIVLAAGQYNVGTIEYLDLTVAGLTLRGATDNPADVVLVGKGFENCDDVEEEMIRLFESNITLADLTVSEVRCNCVKFQGGTNDHTVFHNVRFLNVGERMIKGPGTLVAAQCSIRYCHFENTKIPSVTRCGSTPTDQDGNYIAGMDLMQANGWVIHDNVFMNIKGATGIGRAAVFIWGQSQNMVVERNTFMGCDRSIAFGNFGNSGTIDCIARNNFIVPGNTNGFETANSTGVKVLNNTSFSAVSTNSGAFFLDNATGEVKNNVLCGALTLSGGSVIDTARNILLTRARLAIGARWFGSEAAADLHIKSDTCSPVDAGAAIASVTDDWDGDARTGAYDIGADERLVTDIDKQLSGITGADRLTLALPVPNPFNPTTVIRYKVPNALSGARLTLFVCDLTGRTVRTLCRTVAVSGCHAVVWDGRDNSGRRVSSGIYSLILRCGRLEKSVSVIFRK